MTEREQRRRWFVLVALIDGRAEIFCLDEAEFKEASEVWIGQGFHNLRTEWFEGSEVRTLPDQVTVFAYWEDPELAPSVGELHEWGRVARDLPLGMTADAGIRISRG